MFNTARTSARALLVAASAASFVALGAGIAGADALGGATDGLPLNDLGSQVPAPLTEGVSTPLGDLVQVTPGEVSAAPEIEHNTAPVERAAGEGLSTDAPLEVAEDNAADLGPLALAETLPLSDAADTVSSVDPADAPGTVTGAVEGRELGADPVPGLLGAAGPASHSDVVPLSNAAGDPISGLLGGVTGGDVLGGLAGGTPLGGLAGGDPLGGVTGGLPAETLPMSGPVDGQPLDELNGTLEPATSGQVPSELNGTLESATNAQPLPMSGPVEEADGTVSEVGALAESGAEQVGGGLVGLDETVAMAGTDQPIAVDAGENTDLTGGAGDLVTDLVPADDVLPMAARELPALPETGGATDAVGGVGSLTGAADTDVLPMAAPGTSTVTDLAPGAAGVPDTSAVTDLLGSNALGGDVAAVNGLPEVGEPTVDTGQVTGLLPGGLV
ncbi:hypothetical protein [Nocardiopsis sp. NRRL B-16309]|uniref:hypothetical protein n=1 Tax=Nocardiopsis sp. NRRL B-16309 TaxID=1519494 RepID=UPI0006AF8F74|nr:hypothetical protein [Nocardiopsis sp. NRRL B-16309]KOX13931.1 hypothetical protein ADL05_16770 [Nocardiopsis sp. NRRL B-16309]